MDTEKNITEDAGSTKGAAKMAEAIEKLAALRDNAGSFTYSFKEPCLSEVQAGQYRSPHC